MDKINKIDLALKELKDKASKLNLKIIFTDFSNPYQQACYNYKNKTIYLSKSFHYSSPYYSLFSLAHEYHHALLDEQKESYFLKAEYRGAKSYLKSISREKSILKLFYQKYKAKYLIFKAENILRNEEELCDQYAFSIIDKYNLHFEIKDLSLERKSSFLKNNYKLSSLRKDYKEIFD